MIKNLSAFVSKGKFDRPIEGILITSSMVVATDSFKLIEVKGETGIKDSFTVKLPEKLKSFDTITRAGVEATIHNKGAQYKAMAKPADEYPKYERVIPTEEPIVSIKLSPEHLKEICIAFENGGGMTLSIYGDTKPVVFTNDKEDKRALLMPISK